ncbi:MULTISPECIES: flavodoxin family protein [Streptomyces]|uniref:flavodoxin family protein n=1 Tax=Streptomyces TaxID=1883 RepID=UPI0004BDE644|nr:flavodoxin family protein [Streptomyces griseolus]
MSVLIVAESYFGNTRVVARSIASGLTKALGPQAVTLTRPGEAPRELDSDVTLLLVGAPTHDYSLPKERTREQAAAKGATEQGGGGVQEWIAQLAPRADLRAVTFDTSLEMRFTLGSASKSAYKALKKRGFRLAERGESFRVSGMAGPLIADEEARAEAWGTQLAASLHP